MEMVIEKPLQSVKELMELGQRYCNAAEFPPYVYYIDQERIVLHLHSGSFAHRVFVRAMDSHDYEKVGWILSSDVDVCMICSKSFGVFKDKYHCRACGNLVCDDCSQGRAAIFEIECAGEFRVCSQCYFGQEVVFAHHETLLRESMSVLALSPVEKLVPENSVSKTENQIDHAITSSPKTADSKDAILTIPSTEVKDTANQLAPTAELFFIPTQNPFRIPKNIKFKLVRPVPGIVLKTRRLTSGLKVFINVVVDSSVPFRSENAPGNSDSIQNVPKDPAKAEPLAGFDANKILCLVLGPVHSASDKSGSQSVLYDIVINPNEMKAVLYDVSGYCRQRVSIFYLYLDC